MPLLQDRTAIISGASSGIGRAAALLFAREGANLILIARGAEGLSKVAREIENVGGKAVCHAGDVSLPETHRAAVEQALATFGRLDIAFNNVGYVGPVQPLAQIALYDWQQVVTTNLTSAFLAAAAQLPPMIEQGGGSLIFTGSFVGNSVGLPGMSAYGAAKAGLTGLVKGITADYAHLGIRANALLPGGTDTAMAGDEDQKRWAASLHPVRRIAQPEEIANAALFLASDIASFVNGSCLWADGGNSATKIQAP